MAFLLGIETDSPIDRKKTVKRRKKKGAKIWFNRIVSLLVFLVFSIFFLSFMEFALESPNYTIKNVIVYGLESTTKESLLKNSGLNIEGRNFFLINVHNVEKALLSNPTVSSCKVIKVFPDTVKIYIREEIPFATLCVGDNLYLIDHTARVLKKIYSIKEKVGPLITGVEVLSEVREGDYIEDEGLMSAMEFWYEFNQVPKKMNLTISEIVVDRGSLKVFFNEIPCVTKWKREKLKFQLQKFSLAMKKLDIRKIPCYEYLDFRFGEDIVFR